MTKERRHPHTGPGDWLRRKKRGLTRLRPHWVQGRASHFRLETGRQKTSGVQLIRSVAIYARVSTFDQTCDRQVADLNVLAMRCGYKVVGVFEETASGASGKRKVRQQVIDLAQARRIDAILVTELSRWGRSTPDLLDP